jgi:hypothetical protein
MATVTFTPFIEYHTGCRTQEVFGNTVREVLEAYFATNRLARGYLLDDQDGLRPRLVAYVDGVPVTDRAGLSDPVHAWARVFIQQVPLDTEYESM